MENKLCERKICKANYKANKIINAESVKYSGAMLISFFALIAAKQFLKTFIGLSTAFSCAAGFIIAEIVLFLLQKFYVFARHSVSTLPRQIILSVLNAGIHLLIYEAMRVVFCSKLGLYDFTAWLLAFLMVFIINYAVSKVFIFESLKDAAVYNGGKSYAIFYKNRFVILSVLIAACAMLFIYLVFSVFPFGDTTVLRMDLYHQYGPLFVELYDRVTGGESFFYSWTSGGGSSFLGNYFNYLSSPLTALIFLFDREQMPYAISFLVLVKCMLSAGSFSYYLKASQGKHSPLSAAFGVFYAFSAYFLAYFWNIMWLDAMFLLPFAALGIEKIINEKKCVLYTVTLIIMFISNYYMGYMMCIFCILYFLAYFLIAGDFAITKRKALQKEKLSFWRRLKSSRFLSSGIRFALSSLLAGVLCAFVLLPVVYILSGCSATSDSFPSYVSSYFSALDFIESHFAALETTIRSSGNDVLPNVYCSILALIALPLFVINKNIKLREKFAYIGLLVFFFVCFNCNIANFIWHAFHFPNDLPYRFSYMYSFILLIIAFKAIVNIKAVSIKEIGLVAMGWIAVIAVSQELATEKMTDETIWVSLAFIICWAAVLFIIKRGKVQRAVSGLLVCALAFCEVIIADTGAFDFNQSYTAYTENYDTYTEAVNYVEENDESFYRMELCSLNTRMDPCLYGYSGMSTFSSMAYEAYSGLQYSLGMYGNRINSYTYNTQTPVYNMMYNIKYLIYNGEDSRPSTELYTRCYESESGSAVVYQNDYYMPIAFCANSSILNWVTEEGNPFEIQSDFFALASGYSGVFSNVEYTESCYTDASGDEVSENGTYWFYADYEYSAAGEITLTAVSDGEMYIYLTSSDVSSISVATPQGEINQQLDTPYILDLGYFAAGEQAVISLNCADCESSGSFTIYAYTLNQAVFELGYASLLSGALSITDYSNTSIEGTLTAVENCVLYTSIPYDEGWSVYVDGEKAETFEIGSCQLGIMLKPGEHTVKFKYTPRGAAAGAALSTAAAIALGGVYIYMRKKNRNQSFWQLNRRYVF
ncbi:MAG: YfhO family protein [Clostridiales bacterium]|nr:YfhO family protein [Clostridiales bacterium]